MPIVNAKKKVAAQGAADRTKEPSTTFEGKVVSITGNKLVMTSKSGKQYSRTLAKNAKITCDGADCNAKDLKPGSDIRVTTKTDDRNLAADSESCEKNDDLAGCCG